MKYLSVCSGIEAATCAWHSLGWEPVAFSEIEKFPSQVLAHHYPDVPNLGDMTKFKEWNIGPIDLLVGGTPCQSFSVAGLRKGLDDPRGNLMLTFGAIAAKYRPKFLVWENVPGVLSSNGGHDFASFLGLITGQHIEVPAEGWKNSGIIAGYKNAYGVAYRVLDAQYTGVPQRRRRVFVVGYLGDWRRAAAVLFERHSMSGNIAPSREARKNVTGGFEISPAGGSLTDVAPTIDCRAKNGPIQNQLGAGVIIGADNVAVTQVKLRTIEVSHRQIAFGGNNRSGEIDVATARNACASASGRMDFESETFIVAPCLTSTYGKQPDNSDTNSGPMLLPMIYPINDMATRHAGTDGSGNQAGKGHGLGIGSPDDPMFTLTKGDKHAIAFNLRGREGGAQLEVDPSGMANIRAASGGSSRTMIAFDCKASGQNGFGIGDVASTLRSMGHVNSHQSGGGHQAVMTEMKVRRLTTRECERLQGFPDDFTLIPFGRRIRPEKLDHDFIKYQLRGNPKHLNRDDIDRLAADGPRYKALGNSMAVTCMRWLGERIQMVNDLFNESTPVIEEVA